MLKKLAWTSALAALILGAANAYAAATLQPGVMKWEAYTENGGTSVDALKSDPNFPDSPGAVRIVPAYEGPSGFGDNYGARISGFITPPETGDYVFFIATDDNGELYLSPDDDPAKKKLIARETVWSNSREWVASGGASDLTAKRSDQFTETEWGGSTISLTAGQRYYTELLYKEGTGGDLGGVLAIKKGSPDPTNGAPTLSGDWIAAMVDPDAGPPSILTQPTSATVAAGGSATFTVSAIGAKPLSYQWQRGGVDVPGATSTNLMVNNAGSENFGIYTVVITNSLGTVTSQNATLTVTGLPTLLFIHASGGPNASDLAAMNRLQSKGWQVTPLGASTSQTSDGDGKALIVISSTISSGEVGDKFKSVAVPVLNWEAAVQDNFDMTDRANDADGTTRGVLAAQTQLDIVKADHPLAAGLPAGLVTHLSEAQEASWGVVGPEATVIATAAEDPTRAALYVYEKGATLFDGTTKAPARRVHFPAGDNTFLALNQDGLKLFDAAVDYASGGMTNTPPPPTGNQREYSIGLNFGADEASGANTGSLNSTNVAGVPSVAQANWNNLTLLSGTNNTIVADAGGTAEPTSVNVRWESANTWSSTGRGEENNAFVTNSADWALMTGYLDTGSASTTRVTITSIPARLTTNGYDLYIYAQGGVGGRGGSYRLLDADTGTVIRDFVRAQSGTNLTEYTEVPQNLGATAGTGNRTSSLIFGTGNYFVFRGLTEDNLIVEAQTAAQGGGIGFSGTPRAPINAIQLVAPTSGSTVADVTRPGDTVVSSGPDDRSPATERVPNAIDNNLLTKYLNFGTDTDTAAPFVGPVGLTVTPSARASSIAGIALTSANDAPERDPASYRVEGSNDGTNFTMIAEGPVPPFSGRFIRQEILFTNQLFQAVLSGAAERPTPVESPASGLGLFTLSSNEVSYTITFTNLSAAATAGHIHGPASPEAAAGVLVPFANVTGTSGTLTGTLSLNETQRVSFVEGLTYANIHSGTHQGGEIRGQIVPATFTTYRITFPTVANETTANSLQIAEVELLGTVSGTAPPPASPISINKAGGQITITYQGTLQSATEVGGPYTPVAGATSPYTVTPDGVARFYLAR